MKSRQRGMSGTFVAVVLVIAATVALATLGLSRLTSANRSAEETSTKLARLAEAIEQFVTATGRLPCPANPTLATTDAAWGDEAVPSPNEGACTFPAGTIPWRSVGARADDAIDAWGWKISYRVFSGDPGVAGSLTQAGGASMVECDTFEPTAGSVTALGGASNVMGGLCVSNADTTLRSSREPLFLANKGLRLTDGSSPQRSDVAFVLIDHGPTGFGAYTAAGNQNTLPAAGDELNNTIGTGPFVIKAFSAAGTDPALAAHFDDRLFYRTLSDLVRRTNLVARNWPEPVAPGTTATTFNRATLEATAELDDGFTPGAGGSVGQVTVTFTGVVASALGGSDISFGTAGGYPGIGVAGGGSALMQSPLLESLNFEFSTNTNRKFAITLGDFGTYDAGRYQETAVFGFLQGGSLVDLKVGQGCRSDGGLASFQMEAVADFDQVVVISYYALDTTDMSRDPVDISAFLISEIAACPASATACVTTLTDFDNLCSVL